MPEEIAVKRSDPVYNAHAYLTKVPYSAIVTCIEAATEPGDLVLDVFAGSGMTGVAAAITGRRSELRDISVLGRHIGDNYLNLVDADVLLAEAERVIARTRERIGYVYASTCSRCGTRAELSKAVWSIEYECQFCGVGVNYYETFERAGWSKRGMTCASCDAEFLTRGSKRVDETPVLDHVRCPCSKSLVEQAPSTAHPSVAHDAGAAPDVSIGADRQMFHASALLKHGLTSTAKFFSPRNLAALATLREEIDRADDPAVRSKLLFAFTAILARASKRYQWHPKRPLNAANHNYYIAPVFYEWNVFELFERKIQAAIRSDDLIRSEAAQNGVFEISRPRYVTESSETLDLPDKSVDYVFTDPPFGSQIFYSDMNLFQEAWLGEFTDHSREAVVDRTIIGTSFRTEAHYEALIVAILRECRRVLKDDGLISMVFSNRSGHMWDLVQTAIARAGLSLQRVTLLDKGQRSVKGLASGFESVVTSDLILTMNKGQELSAPHLDHAPVGTIARCIDEALGGQVGVTPSSIYLSVVTEHLHNGWRAAELSIDTIRNELEARGIEISPATSELVRDEGTEVAAA